MIQKKSGNYWKKYKELGGDDKFAEFKEQLIREFNDLHIEGMPQVKTLNYLVGAYINMEYTLPGGKKVKFLDDNATYLGYQLESEFGGDRCFGIAAHADFLLVCTYGKDGENPELVVYKKRQKIPLRLFWLQRIFFVKLCLLICQ